MGEIISIHSRRPLDKAAISSTFAKGDQPVFLERSVDVNSLLDFWLNIEIPSGLAGYLVEIQHNLWTQYRARETRNRKRNTHQVVDAWLPIPNGYGDFFTRVLGILKDAQYVSRPDEKNAIISSEITCDDFSLTPAAADAAYRLRELIPFAFDKDGELKTFLSF